MAHLVRGVALNLITMVLSLSVHEFCHAVVADRLGDDTPRRQGRLTLSPVAHYDVFGTFLIPAFAAVLGGVAFIGWARPVETVPSNYTRRLSMRAGEMLVAAAGPLSNLFLSVMAMAGLAALLAANPGGLQDDGNVGAAASFLAAMTLVNAGLCVFNLFPLPPLDGARLLPRSMDDFQKAVAPFSFFIILIILNVPMLRNLFWVPVGLIQGILEAIFGVSIGTGA
jgi:Zn-dependent protease